MKLIVTIYEETFDSALRAIAALRDADHDMIELRAEKFGAIDLNALRASTSKPILLTHRGMRVDDTLIERAVSAGIDLVDVEWHPSLTIERFRERIVLSHHDYEGVSGSIDAMRRFGCAHVKLAVTPKTLELLPPGSVVLHPGPVNRGVELSPEVLDSDRSLVMDQVDSGVAVRMAALALCLRARVSA